MKSSSFRSFAAILWIASTTHGFQSHKSFGSRIHQQQILTNNISSRNTRLSSSSEDSELETTVKADPKTAGLYKKFADHASEKLLLASGFFQEMKVPEDLAANQSSAKGMPNSVVRISTQAMVPTENHCNLVQYARITLLETVPAATGSDASSTTSTAGIQVLNFVVLPAASTTLPVLGIDLVSLPGGRHLLLMDAQPMVAKSDCPGSEHWKEWYEKHVEGHEAIFPWGGDFPEPVQKYVSKHSLWTRLQEVENPTDVIQTNVWEAFMDHLDAYLDLLEQYKGDKFKNVQGDNHQVAYLDYRRGNDPAKPMLNSLYGAEWTDQLLDEVLFPK